jgi:pimeloyl-ACP methyl ester carboxylesterase
MRGNAMTSWTRRSVLAAAGLGLAGCMRAERPSLGELYASTRFRTDQPPLIVIPGAFGSALRDRSSGREIWPGPDTRLLFSRYRELELAIDPERLEPLPGPVEAFEIFKRGLGRDFYGQVLDTLQQAGGYTRCNACEQPRSGRRNFYVYIYDFRLDNVTAVRGLHDLIVRIRSDYGDARQPVDILAHSNGGLLARYYARYGTRDVLDDAIPAPDYAGAPAIRRLLLVGTPNLGTMQPVLSHTRGEEIGLAKIPPEVMATCPAPPQVMPHPLLPWLALPDGQDLSRDLYDIATWSELEWSIFAPDVAERTIANHGGGAEGRRYLETLRAYMARHFRRGRRFAEALSVTGDERDARPYLFGGDCAPTLKRLVVEEVNGRRLARERVADIARPVAGVDYATLMFEPGDLVVTRSSLLGRIDRDVAAPRDNNEQMRIEHSVFLCEKHQSLTGNPSFQDNLLYALLSSDPA